jgi:hypothetical protein
VVEADGLVLREGENPLGAVVEAVEGTQLLNEATTRPQYGGAARRLF